VIHFRLGRKLDFAKLTKEEGLIFYDCSRYEKLETVKQTFSNIYYLLIVYLFAVPPGLELGYEHLLGIVDDLFTFKKIVV
jgi:hypothetical protein